MPYKWTGFTAVWPLTLLSTTWRLWWTEKSWKTKPFQFRQELNWEVNDLQTLPRLVVSVQEQCVQHEHLFKATYIPWNGEQDCRRQLWQGGRRLSGLGEWVLKGEASFGEVGVEDLCGRDGSTFFQFLIYWRTLNDWRNGGAWCSSDVVWGCLGGVWVLVYLGGILGCQSCSGGNLRVQSMQNWAALKQTHHFGTTLKCSRRFRKCGTYWAFLLNFVVWFHIVCDRYASK